MSNFAYLFTPLSVTLSTFQDHSCMPNWRDVMVMPCSDLLLKWLHSHSMMWMSCLTEVCCWSGYVHTAWCGCHAWLKSAAEVATFTQHDADVMPDWSGYVHTAWCGCHAWLKSVSDQVLSMSLPSKSGWKGKLILWTRCKSLVGIKI